MHSDEPRFKHIGLSSDGTVVFCDLDNGKTYPMPLNALERAEEWNSKAKAKAVHVIHDGYAAEVEFDTGAIIDFPTDFVLHVCEPSYAYYQDKRRATSGVGGRIREIREARGLTLDALAVRCGIAKPNLSRLENDKVTPKFETLQTIASALKTHPALLLSNTKPELALTWTFHAFTEWKLSLLWKEAIPPRPIALVRVVDMVEVFLTTRPEYRYAKGKLLKRLNLLPRDPDLCRCSLDAEKWAKERAEAKAA